MTESYLMTAAILEHVQAVAFDLDGTLCDSIPDLTAAAQAMCEYLGLPVLPTQTVESYVGDGIGKLVHRVITHDREKEADPEIWEKGFVFFMKYYREHLSDFTRPYPETEAGLGLLKSLGIPLVVITNKNEVLAAELLKQLNLDSYFSLVLGGDSLTEKKPNPLPLQHAAEVLGIDVANMLMVGDSKNDILAAKAAGCFSIGVTFGYGDMTLLSQDKATKPDLLIRALPEIYENLQPQKNKDEE
ncbi:Phosphoglycolate phosphatase [Neisseria subflava]|uniref:Phosphoglycolate phosphatase n=2 Tax=Neisseria subflava TaxID=28449 RepID=A0A9X9R0H6_NEISU|nr:Phosphoglycolate phosphatase [Neisseria subflava]